MSFVPPDPAELDNPIWSALTSGHASMAIAHGRARRYPPTVSAFAAMEAADASAFEDLSHIVGADERVALFTSDLVNVPDTWQTHRTFWLDQMVCSVVAEPASIDIRELDRSDVPEMLALTAATQPGPFLEDTIRMGRYIGIRTDDGRLAAMAGQRLRPAGFTELSAVCTDPAFRGRGYAAALITILAADLWRQGVTPMLHVMTDNPAKRLYDRLGFHFRRPIRFTLIAPR